MTRQGSRQGSGVAAATFQNGAVGLVLLGCQRPTKIGEGHLVQTGLESLGLLRRCSRIEINRIVGRQRKLAGGNILLIEGEGVVTGAQGNVDGSIDHRNIDRIQCRISIFRQPGKAARAQAAHFEADVLVSRDLVAQGPRVAGRSQGHRGRSNRDYARLGRIGAEGVIGNFGHFNFLHCGRREHPRPGH